MSRVHAATLVGVDGAAIEVEVRISSQLPRIDIVGLPEAAVRESAARVRAAIISIGERFPDRRVTVNLAPASLRKSGAGLDLPIAVGILAAAGALDQEGLTKCAFLGELALDGRLRPVRGALALVMAAGESGCRQVFVPAANGCEAALARGIAVFAAADLLQVLLHLRGVEEQPLCEATSEIEEPDDRLCVEDVRGQEGAKRALEIAAAGGHGLLLCGPPGSGKTMLARRLPGLLPPLTFDEAIEVTRIHGTANQLDASQPIIRSRPFRAPHHTSSAAGLLGGGNPIHPGEASLAHRGVLFMDELPEFDRRTLESLRQVLEAHHVRIARATASCTFPAHFQLIAAMNPCPCGWYRSGQRDCRCDDATIARYRTRISGPLLDRIDLHVQVPAVSWRDLGSAAAGPTTAEMRTRVQEARKRQAKRGPWSNAEVPDSALDEVLSITPDARALLGRAVDRLRLSARGAHRIMRAARSVADLAACDEITPPAIAEAVQHRTETLGSSD